MTMRPMFDKDVPNVLLKSLMAGIDIGNGLLAIGDESGLPWHCPDDMKFFREQTLGETCIVSMKTLTTIPNLLRGRSVIAITSDLTKFGYSYDTFARTVNWVTVVSSKEEAFKVMVNRGVTEGIVIGGAEIYKLFEPNITTKIISMLPKNIMTSTPTVFMDKPKGPTSRIAQYGNNQIHYYNY